jgi:SAM-dependent methyltransferase
VSFDVAAESYDRFMGRFSTQLAAPFADFAGVSSGQRVLDVGCGPGALTTELVARLGVDAVTAIDPSEPFVEAARERHPGVRVERGAAERLPFADGEFDAALAQLVVHFMDDPVAGLREAGRVTRDGGVVAACVWDHGGSRGPLSLFWEGARSVDPELTGEADLAGASEGQLGELFAAAGLTGAEETALTVAREYESFDEWWEPYTLGVGPAGGYVARLDAEKRDRVREACRSLLPPAPFTIEAYAWTARASTTSP